MKTDWIQTYTGRKVYPLELTPDQVCIEDIAHALALKCRFGGHCLKPYSVAEHSIRVASILPPDKRIFGLLHDAGEGYLPDLPAPIKREFYLNTNVRYEDRTNPAQALIANPPAKVPPFKEVERHIMWTIGEALGVPLWDMPAAVKQADLILLATEARDLMSTPPEPWSLDVPVLPDRIEPISWEEAEQRFLEEFRLLTKTTNVV